ncbi:ESX secretion-associated protein EspG [Nocardia macrotermitis]|uniref:Uncharacterized protein n=1 Tax=Nocardia macrotermitis TaxID=2585198 RepID=A0A7K0D9U3_9NOCA|nr:ESX secretion-associated protein EspG [Nocardia macrotermitis]MQY22487.1 hypothetical protein [Nocardia macrotermitis]
MERTWYVEGLEFVILMKRLLGRTLPPPFTYLSPTLQTRINALNEEARIWKQLRANWDPDLADLISWTGEPELRIEVSAWDPRDDGPALQYDMLCFRSGSRAALIEGFYNAAGTSCERYRIVECDPAELSSLIVEALPQAPAGTQGRVELSDYEISGRGGTDDWSRGGRSSFYDDGDNDLDVRSRGWQQSTKSLVGMIGFHQGNAEDDAQAGPMPPNAVVIDWADYLFWEDHPDDGRYLVELTPPVSAVGIDADGLRRRIDQKAAEVLRTSWEENSEPYARSSIFDD